MQLLFLLWQVPSAARA